MLKSGKIVSPLGGTTRSVHAYARGAAVCLTQTTNRRSEPVLSVEFALSTGAGGYAWGEKSVFQWTQTEIAEAAAFLWAPWESIAWTHGRGGDLKELSLEQQGLALLFTLRIGPQRWRVPVAPGEQYFIRNFVVAELLSQQPCLPVEFHLKSLSGLADQLSKRSRS